MTRTVFSLATSHRSTPSVWALVCALFLPIVLGAPHALAFPEMIRAGYTNCTSCHVSPSGGGLLTDYGRNLSSEVLSTWGSEKEAQLGHGIFGTKDEKNERDEKGDSGKDKLDQWFGVGGDVRAVQAHEENEFAKVGRFIWMQAMLDLGYRIGNWTAVGSIGKFASDGSNTWRADSERFYLMRQLGDENSVRVGRFTPNFGLNIPDHISPTRQTLGFGFGQERDGAEWNYIGENWNAAFGADRGPRDGEPIEQAVYGQLQRSFSEHYKVGASLWAGKNDAHSSRQLAAVHGMFGFTPHVYLLAEEDTQLLHVEGSKDETGFFGYYKLGYEFRKGMHILGLLDHAQSDQTNGKDLTRHWGAGLMFFPRPHFEISGAWTRELVRAVSDKEGDYAWILFHYYL